MSLELFAIGSSGLALAVVAVMVLTGCNTTRRSDEVDVARGPLKK